MAWQTPKTDWAANNVVTTADLNRIEGNIAELKKAATIDVADVAGNFTSNPKTVENVLNEIAGDVKNGKTAIANAITAMGQSAAATDAFNTLAAKIRAISTDATAAEGDVLSGKTFYAGGSKKTGSLVIDGTKFIKSIQQGIVSGTSSATITINAVDISKSIVICEFAGSDYGLNTVIELRNATLQNSTTLFIDFFSSRTALIGWKVIEFQPDVVKSIQRGTGKVGGHTQTNITINAVDITKSFVIITGMSIKQDYIYIFGGGATGLLVNSTTLSVWGNNYGYYGSYEVSFGWQVCEFT